MKIVLIATYEMGRQPFGLASPAAWLAKRGHEVVCVDLSRQGLEEAEVREAGLIGFYLPMHTATRLAMEAVAPIRTMNAKAKLCAFGLYAALNEASLRKAGFGCLIGGEFEEELVRIAEGAAQKWDGYGKNASAVEKGKPKIARLKFEVPNRATLPALKEYVHLVMPNGEHRTTGYTEASRGCKHLCRHCPIVPVYEGQFRVVEREVVLADVRQQVVAGARHITFGDPDFFNGITHAIRIVEEMHAEFPELTYDATIKVEHLKRHRAELAKLRETGCVFVTSAVESLDDVVLEKLRKGHTRADFVEVLAECRRVGLGLQPTFVAFTPWTTAETYLRLLDETVELELEETVAPIQLGIRLLIPAGSKLLELQEIRASVGEFDEKALVYAWWHQDTRMDRLAEEVQAIASDGGKSPRGEIFGRIYGRAQAMLGRKARAWERAELMSRATIPYLNEPWYC